MNLSTMVTDVIIKYRHSTTEEQKIYYQAQLDLLCELIGTDAPKALLEKEE